MAPGQLVWRFRAWWCRRQCYPQPCAVRAAKRAFLAVKIVQRSSTPSVEKDFDTSMCLDGALRYELHIILPLRVQVELWDSEEL